MANIQPRQHITTYLKCLIFVVFASPSWSQCPERSAIAPCVCEEGNGVVRQVSCRGAMGLPRLTTILRGELCGRTVEKFQLMDSDVGYLPSNLFFKTIVKDIQVSSTNISHFTRAGRSAFYGLERHLSSLSMRRCRLIDALQWQMIGDLYVLSYLDLSYNSLTRVPQQWFQRPPPNLLSLILKGNSISLLESGALSQMHQLIELDLSENEIVTLSRDVFPHPGNALLFLRLNDNLIQSLPDDFFDEMLGVRRIYLDNNRLEVLSERVWTPVWGDLDHLNLDGNHFECGCDLFWIGKLRSPKQLYGECYADITKRLPNDNRNIYNNTVIPSKTSLLSPKNTTVVLKKNVMKLRELEVVDFELCEFMS